MKNQRHVILMTARIEREWNGPIVTPLDRSTAIKHIGNVTELSSRAGALSTHVPSSLTKWLNTEQAAKYLGIPPGSLRNMTSNGLVRYFKLGRRNRYRLSDLHELLLSKKRGS